MEPSQLVSLAKGRFEQAVSHLGEELKKVRTGRAHGGMLDGLMVNAYGTAMPLIQLATVSTPEPQLLQIAPFDPGTLAAISAAIRDNPSLSLNPMDDGRVVRIQIPPLNEERRREYAKMVHAKLEDCLVGLRNVRHEAMRDLDQAKKDKNISEDDAKRAQKQLDEQIAHFKAEAEAAANVKEAEIMKV